MAALRGRAPDVLIVETDPPLLCLVGAALRKWFKCRLIVYLQDLYPDLGVAIGKLPNNWAVRTLRRAFLRVYRSADRVIVLSDDMKQVLLEAGVDGERIVKIPNWVDSTQVVPVKQQKRLQASAWAP